MAIPVDTLMEEAKCYLCLGISQAQALELALLNRAASGGYSEYVASVTQSGGAVAPTSTVLSNTLIGTPVWSYLGAGEYRLTLNGGFPVGRTVVVFGPPSAADGPIILQGQTNDALEILIGAGEDGRLDKVALIIRVYP